MAEPGSWGTSLPEAAQFSLLTHHSPCQTAKVESRLGSAGCALSPCSLPSPLLLRLLHRQRVAVGVGGRAPAVRAPVPGAPTAGCFLPAWATVRAGCRPSRPR